LIGEGFVAVPVITAGGARAPQVKQRTAALSVFSNSALILLKVIAATVTGSVAILTEAVHSSRWPAAVPCAIFGRSS